MRTNLVLRCEAKMGICPVLVKRIRDNAQDAEKFRLPMGPLLMQLEASCSFESSIAALQCNRIKVSAVIRSKIVVIGSDMAFEGFGFTKFSIARRIASAVKFLLVDHLMPL